MVLPPLGQARPLAAEGSLLALLALQELMARQQAQVRVPVLRLFQEHVSGANPQNGFYFHLYCGF